MNFCLICTVQAQQEYLLLRRAKVDTFILHNINLYKYIIFSFQKFLPVKPAHGRIGKVLSWIKPWLTGKRQKRQKRN